MSLLKNFLNGTKSLMHKYKVVIDPGHGGYDSGAVNNELEIKEKDITLKIGTYMFNELMKESYPNILPSMTRDSDVGVSLGKRCEYANSIDASLFISIHINSRPMRGKYGLEIETYYYGSSVNGKAFASIVQKNLISQEAALPVIDREIKEGLVWSVSQKKYVPYYVLKNTKMPAILSELGFICDEEEAMLLNNNIYQRMIGGNLAKSVGEYFRGGVLNE